MPADDGPQTHAEATYTPDRRRDGVALCLSGGGYRAALFHLGALTRLNELGILSKVDTYSSVSGGSILAAHLATRIDAWPDAGKPLEDWSTRIVEPFLRFTRRNIRNRPILRRYGLPWNWFRSRAAVDSLEGRYRKHLTDAGLRDLPRRPRFIMSATDMAFGVNWVFDSAMARMGDYQAGYTPTPDWPLARAVAASSCFPPVFDPLPLELDPSVLKDGDYDEADRDDLVREIALSDGGVYDNMGLEPVWKNHETVLVSDGGAVFEAQRDAGFIWRLNRYASIAGRQGSAVRRRWLIANYIAGQLEGTYWSIGSVPAHYAGAAGYPESLIESRIQKVRTDLDRFSRVEQQVLQNHGYLLAEAAIQTHAPQLVAIGAPASAPYPGDPMDPGWVAAQLESSHKHRIFGH